MRTWRGVFAHWRSSGCPASFYTWLARLLSAPSAFSQASTAQRGWSAEKRAGSEMCVVMTKSPADETHRHTAAHRHMKNDLT